MWAANINQRRRVGRGRRRGGRGITSLFQFYLLEWATPLLSVISCGDNSVISHKLELIYRRIWFTYSLAMSCNHRPKSISSRRRGRGKGQNGRIRGAGRRELSCSRRLQPMKNIVWFSLRILLFALSGPWIFNDRLEQNGVGVSVVSIQDGGCRLWLGGAGRRSERWKKEERDSLVLLDSTAAQLEEEDLEKAVGWACVAVCRC